MQVNKHSRKYIKLEETLYDNNKNLSNNYVKQQLFVLLQDPPRYLNDNLYLNTSLHQFRIRKRASNCSTKNGNLG